MINELLSWCCWFEQGFHPLEEDFGSEISMPRGAPKVFFCVKSGQIR